MNSRVAVCVATFRRPELLAGLLASLARLERRRRPAEVRVIVVDNDAAESAHGVVEAAREGFPFALEYAVEPERNISLARNRAVAMALAWGAEWVAFVDDDEVVRPEWLDELLEVQARSGADAVAGAVVPRFSAGAPAWAERSGVYARLHRRSGEPVASLATHNALVSARLLRRDGGPFDPAFGISGGGDSLFFLRCAREGARMVGAAAAVVEESIPPERLRTGWVLRRAFRTGNGAVFAERALPPENRRVGQRVVKGVARMAASAAALPFAALFGRAAATRALWGVCYGAGCASALVGYRYHEYRDAAR
ncbi:MAG: glycosyltransferase family 2 protein [Longimicrobiaceae bacterium]